MLTPEAARTKPQILICDDDIEFSTEMVEALRARGFAAAQLLTVSAARAAILSPSILLLDLCMPGRDAIEILRLLSENERKSRFKVVLMSGWDPAMLDAAAKLCELWEIELLGVFRKPVSLQPLCALLEEAVLGELAHRKQRER
jgi:DNA-binding response OmpR family regulator